MALAVQTTTDLIALEEQRRFERFLYLGTVGVWLTAVLMVAAVLWLMPQSPQLHSRALLWGGLFTLLMLASVLSWFSTGRHLATMQARDRWHTVLVVAHGLMWAMPPLIFFEPQLGGQAVVSMFMLCMVSGASAAAVPIFGTRPKLYLLMFVPIYVAQIGVFSLHGWRERDGFHALLGLAMLLLLSVNLVFCRFTWATFRRSIELAYDNEELVRQLQAQTQELSEQTRAAQEANTAKTKFLAAASHDLRQPAHALNLFVEVLAGTELDAKQSTMVQHIRAATRASADMLNTLLDYSRIEAGVMRARPVETPLAPLLRTLEDEFGPQADNQKLVYRTRDSTAVALCDSAMTLLILRNLVSNALRYTPRGGVLVAVRRRAQTLVVQVWDTGIGIAPEHQEEVFKEFHQLGNAERDRQKGLGLGLAIAKGLAQSMSARLELNSRPGQGSVFSLVLPAVLSPLARREHSVAALRSGGWQASELAPVLPRKSMPPAQPAMHLKGLRVLVVDDEEGVRISMQNLLEGWGCQVHTCESPAQALNYALAARVKAAAPQLLITDYRLREGATGGEVIALLRNSLPKLAAIIVTGDTAPERLREAASHEATLLHKPVSAQTLEQAMRALLL